MKKWILNCTVERDICRPQIFNSFNEANKEMKEEFSKSCLENDDAYFGNGMAYGSNLNHDNIDWKIDEVEID